MRAARAPPPPDPSQGRHPQGEELRVGLMPQGPGQHGNRARPGVIETPFENQAAERTGCAGPGEPGLQLGHGTLARSVQGTEKQQLVGAFGGIQVIQGSPEGVQGIGGHGVAASMLAITCAWMRSRTKSVICKNSSPTNAYPWVLPGTLPKIRTTEAWRGTRGSSG